MELDDESLGLNELRMEDETEPGYVEPYVDETIPAALSQEQTTDTSQADLVETDGPSVSHSNPPISVDGPPQTTESLTEPENDAESAPQVSKRDKRRLKEARKQAEAKQNEVASRSSRKPVSERREPVHVEAKHSARRSKQNPPRSVLQERPIASTEDLAKEIVASVEEKRQKLSSRWQEALPGRFTLLALRLTNRAVGPGPRAFTIQIACDHMSWDRQAFPRQDSTDPARPTGPVGRFFQGTFV